MLPLFLISNSIFLSHDNFIHWKMLVFVCRKGGDETVQSIQQNFQEGLEAFSYSDVSAHLKCIYSSKCLQHECFRALVDQFVGFLRPQCALKYSRTTVPTYTGHTLIWCFLGVIYISNHLRVLLIYSYSFSLTAQEMLIVVFIVIALEESLYVIVIIFRYIYVIKIAFVIGCTLSTIKRSMYSS